jgi:hypothetical protein
MTASFARAHSRGSGLGLTTLVRWEERGGTALEKWGSVRDEIPPNTELCRAWTGSDHRPDGFSSFGPRDHGARLVALSSLALSISVLLQGVSARLRMGFQPQSRWDRFRVGSSIQTGGRRSVFCAWDGCLRNCSDDSAQCLDMGGERRLRVRRNLLISSHFVPFCPIVES